MIVARGAYLMVILGIECYLAHLLFSEVILAKDLSLVKPVISNSLAIYPICDQESYVLRIIGEA